MLNETVIGVNEAFDVVTSPTCKVNVSTFSLNLSYYTSNLPIEYEIVLDKKNESKPES